MFKSQATLDADDNDIADFTPTYNYHSVYVSNFNYGTAGTYTVVW
ncbi:hypothetical protein GCM10010911_68820 [Paenibacillus nasutitermitis]|uniref:Uncharacterized protein n=1 Tax=Paenibacillus nasutitermitis TaxID=1652958 RepID=A0A916ZJC2_9BACL|nr:hypothetical protein GCM10010911_68820 [Paenibacillus nasutitermitis]